MHIILTNIEKSERGKVNFVLLYFAKNARTRQLVFKIILTCNVIGVFFLNSTPNCLRVRSALVLHVGKKNQRYEFDMFQNNIINNTKISETCGVQMFTLPCNGKKSHS